MNTFDGFFLPQIVHSDIEEWRTLDAGRLRVRYPVLTRTQVAAVWLHLLTNRNRVLVHAPVANIVSAIGAAAGQLRANGDETIELVSAATGYSAPVVAETLGRMCDDWSESSLNTLIASELGDARVLDQPVPDAGATDRLTAAFGYPRAFHVFSGNVPGVAVTSLIRSLLVKSATFGKTASGEPVLPVLFARALHQVAPEMAACIALSYWPHDVVTQTAALELADLVVVYGGADAVQSIRSTAPGETRVIVHGPRLSFGLVGTQATARTVRSVATAIAAYDQQGCVSPHVVYVVGDRARARTFAGDVARELRQLAVTLPRGTITPAEAVAIRNARTAAEFAENAELFGSEQEGFSVIYEDTPEFKLSCLNRVLYVKPLSAPADVLQVLPRRDVLQSAALDGFEQSEKAELARALGLSGISRVTSFDRLPWPPMHWHHDGSSPLRELVWWQDIES